MGTIRCLRVPRFYPTLPNLVHTLCMTQHIFEPVTVPLNSQALVATLKCRLTEAVETGKASEARIFVDIIDRLAKMAWLDDITPAERLEVQRANQAYVMADVDRRLIQLLKAQLEDEAASNQHL